MGFHADNTKFGTTDKKEAYEQVLMSCEALLIDNWVANTANTASLLWHMYDSLNSQVNWAGFYVTDDKDSRQLVLGPFQGKVACQVIQFGKGVCGTAAQSKEVQVVEDVEKFPGHIACDGDTKSEIVVPILDPTSGQTIGVIDIDSVKIGTFDEVDKEYLVKIAALLAKQWK